MLPSIEKEPYEKIIEEVSSDSKNNRIKIDTGGGEGSALNKPSSAGHAVLSEDQDNSVS